MTPTIEIRTVSNGYILEDAYGNTLVARSLMEAAQINGEAPVISNTVHYYTGKGAHTLENIRNLSRDGQKIEAIKELRDLFSHRLGLKEAKEMIEILTKP